MKLRDLATVGCLLLAGCVSNELVGVTVFVTGTGSGRLEINSPLGSETCDLVNGTASTGCTFQRTEEGAATGLITITPAPGTNVDGWGGNCASSNGQQDCSISYTGANTVVDAIVTLGTQDANSLDLAPADIMITDIASPVNVTAMVLSAEGNPISGATVTWGIDDAGVATVSGTGATATVTAVADGVTEVWATAVPALPSFTEGRTTVTVTLPSSSFVFDHDFTSTSTTAVQQIVAANGASWMQSHQATGGNPDGYEALTHELPDGSGGTASAITTVHTFGVSYDPASQGAISSIDYSVDQRVGTMPVGTGLTLTQGLNIYLYRHAADISSTSWESVAFNGLVATDFTLLSGPGPGANPDFSAGATQSLSLGFARISENYTTAAAASHAHHIDNYRVEVHR